jgi:hypothetical protein
MQPVNPDPWLDWSYEESETEEELSADEILNRKVLQILKSSIIKKEINKNGKENENY